MSTCETPVHFAGWGADVPSEVLHNEELEQRFGVEEGWIASKTGIGYLIWIRGSSCRSTTCSSASW